MKEIDLDQLLDTAVRAAKTAGRHALENKARRTEATKTYTHDVKLVLDAECQKKAEGVIAAEFPDHAVLGEEDARPNASAAYEWIIDPIDGTVNFTHGFPYWCCSVAVRRNGKVLAGCVYAAEFNACYTAHIESPAMCNGKPIQVSDVRNLKDALIITGLSKALEGDPERHFSRFQTLALKTQKLRIVGAAALDMCHVANGTCEGFYESGIYVWDFAAAGLIVERAGGAFSIVPRRDDTFTVFCTNAHLNNEIRAIHEQFS